MAAVSAAALALAGLESTKLLLSMFPSYDQRKVKEFEVDYEMYKLQKTMDENHPDINDSLFLRVRHRLFEHVEAVNAFARANGKDS